MFEREQVWYVKIYIKIYIKSNVIPRSLISRAVQVSSSLWGVQAPLKNWSESVWSHLCLLDLPVTLVEVKLLRGSLQENRSEGICKHSSYSHSGSCLFLNYSFISLSSKGGPSAQHRNLKYVNLYQMCITASYLARHGFFLFWVLSKFSNHFPSQIS